MGERVSVRRNMPRGTCFPSSAPYKYGEPPGNHSKFMGKLFSNCLILFCLPFASQGIKAGLAYPDPRAAGLTPLTATRLPSGPAPSMLWMAPGTEAMVRANGMAPVLDLSLT